MTLHLSIKMFLNQIHQLHLHSYDHKPIPEKRVTILLFLWNQSHYRDVPLWEIFMEQELRFGLDLGRLALLK